LKGKKWRAGKSETVMSIDFIDFGGEEREAYI
jgi:hypothetical protein